MFWTDDFLELNYKYRKLHPDCCLWFSIYLIHYVERKELAFCGGFFFFNFLQFKKMYFYRTLKLMKVKKSVRRKQWQRGALMD